MSEYRRQLRDFPTVWSAGVPFPEKPAYGGGDISYGGTINPCRLPHQQKFQQIPI